MNRDLLIALSLDFVGMLLILDKVTWSHL